MKSYWIESVKSERKQFPSLEEDTKVDVCIIGGGLTGLTTAYYLSKTNLKVALIEKDRLCEHTSGNTTAKITSQHGLFYDYLIQSEGEEKARQYLQANEQAIQNIEKIVKEENIDCDFQRQDNYVYTLKQKELLNIKKEVEAVNSLGFPAKFVSNVDLPFRTLGAISFPNQAQFNPCKYANGLVRAIRKQDKVFIFEKTKVTDVKNSKEDKYTVITENGKNIVAKYVVIASHYPIINIPGYYFLKMYQEMSYLIAIETKMPLPKGMYINSEKRQNTCIF